MHVERHPYAFEKVQSDHFYFDSKGCKENFSKWNLDQTSRVVRFRINQKFQTEDEAAFFKALFEDEQVRKYVQLPEKPSADNLDFVRLPVSIYSMEFFDKLWDAGIVSHGGYIRRCMDEFYDGLTVSDLLRDMLVNEMSENAHLFTDDEKKQFIFNIFKQVVLGGSLCQPEDIIDPYLTATKDIYRALMTVQRNSKTSQVEISSLVYQYQQPPQKGMLFSTPSPYNTCYVIVDVKKRMVTIWLTPFVSFW